MKVKKNFKKKNFNKKPEPIKKPEPEESDEDNASDDISEQPTPVKTKSLPSTKTNLKVSKKSKIEPEADEDSYGSSSDDDGDDDAHDPVKANDKVLQEMDQGESSSDNEEAPVKLSGKKLKVEAQDQSKTDVKEANDPKKPAYEKADEAKTVFCGNIPNLPNVNETRIKDLFNEYGTVRSVRFRTDTGKVIFSKKIRKECPSFLAYVVFEKEEDAQKSTQLNGFKLLTNHLRVNMANKKNEAFTNKGTIFVGNLPFDATETEVHGYFAQVGEIEYVRKIANKGIAYVCFQKGVNLSIALKLNDKPFKGRNLRISRCESRDKQDKKKMFKKDQKTGKIVKQKVRRPHKMNEDAFMHGRHNNNPIIKKIKETQKAKFNKFTDAHQQSKKELFRRGGKMDQNQREEKREKFTKKQKYFGAKVDGIDKTKSKKSKTSKSIKQQKVIAKKLKSAASRVAGATKS